MPGHVFAPVAGVESCAWPRTMCYEEATDEVLHGFSKVGYCPTHARMTVELYDDALLASRDS